MGTISSDDVALHLVPSLKPNTDPDIVYPTVADPCDGTYVCTCLPCQLVRAHRVKMGVRSTPSLPRKLRPAA